MMRPYRLPFLDSRKESPTTATFRFSTSGTGFRYRPTQFIALHIEVDDPWGPLRRFSLSSSPTEEGILSITTKLTGSPYKEALQSLRPGDPGFVAGPFGHFILEEKRPAILVAGGIGISPFRGMMRYAADRTLDQPIRLLYSARTPDEFVFRDEIEDITRLWPQLQVTYTVSRPGESKTPWSGRTGRIDGSLIRTAAEELDAPVYYACGTPGMVDDTIDLLLNEVRVPRQDVRVEAFMGF